MHDMVKALKTLGDEGRLRVLALLAFAGEACVCEVQEVLEMSTPTASRNLRLLEDAGWCESRREGKWVYYRLTKLTLDRQLIIDGLQTELNACDIVVKDREKYEVLDQQRSVCKY